MANLVLVRWRDAAHWRNEQTQEDVDKAQPGDMETVGWLVGQNANRLVVASERVADCWRDVTAIPMEGVVEVVRLRARGKGKAEREADGRRQTLS